MKYTFCLFAILSFSILNAQRLGSGIPETLTSKELRIIRSYNLGNTDIVRIFKSQTSPWKFELYKSEGEEDPELVETRIISKEENFDEKLWLRILMTDIQFVADYKQVLYKFKKNKEIIFLDDSWTIFYDQPWILDGEGFKIKIKNQDKMNEVRYSNPDAYLNIYPEIDELITVVDLLQIIRNEFEIWKD